MTNTIDGVKYAALLTAAATLGGGAYSYWKGADQHIALVALAAGVALSGGVTGVAKLGRATWRHELGWGWWLNIPAAAVAGMVLGVIKAPGHGEDRIVRWDAGLMAAIPVRTRQSDRVIPFPELRPKLVSHGFTQIDSTAAIR